MTGLEKEKEKERQKENVNVIDIVKEIRAGFEAKRKKLKKINKNKNEVKKWIENLRKKWRREKEMLIRKIEGLEKRVKERDEKEAKKVIGGNRVG
ncbi:hypothetical protein PUN28_020839 [Cardiocondyla obscurior]|uniref:Uncharacterized protein n=1 Tax=Cardiocondyla obscurior TaxID=286306 RepID=A0AAW2E5H4_9HYME